MAYKFFSLFFIGNYKQTCFSYRYIDHGLTNNYKQTCYSDNMRLENQVEELKSSGNEW